MLSASMQPVEDGYAQTQARGWRLAPIIIFSTAEPPKLVMLVNSQALFGGFPNFETTGTPSDPALRVCRHADRQQNK
eukprot:3959234-Amphidinium_carterae.1